MPFLQLLSVYDGMSQDKICKVCYACGEAFTMYRRRHHCRMCGQVFCNPCSSYYIDTNAVAATGLMRSCQLCYEQLGGRLIIDTKSKPRRKRTPLGSMADMSSELQVLSDVGNVFGDAANFARSTSSDKSTTSEQNMFVSSTLEEASDLKALHSSNLQARFTQQYLHVNNIM